MVPTSDIVLFTLAAALLAALGHVLIVLGQVHLAGRLSGASVDFAILAPPGYVVVFGVLALPLLIGVRFLPARWQLPLVVGYLTAFGAFALLVLLTMIHELALVLVAVGAGMRVAATAQSSPAAARVWARRLIAGSSMLLGVAAGLTLGTRELRQLSAAARHGQAAPGSPNIIVLILDTVRAANLSVYGYRRETTPRLSQLAARGVAFDRAFSVSSWSAPAHASMVTGLWGSETGADYLRPMRRSAATLGEALNEHGYSAGGFVGNYMYAGRGLGIDRGFSHFEDFPISLEQMVWSTSLANTGSGRRIVRAFIEVSPYPVFNAIRFLNLRFGNYEQDRRPTAEIVRRFWAWHDQLDDEPWFAMINLMDAHAPYQPPDGFATRFANGSRDLDRYDGAIAYLDSVTGSIEDSLRHRGELDRTTIIVTADHGELWGEHGMDGHGNSLYLPVLHVPLVMAGAGVPHGVRVSSVVSVRDLAATILDLANARDHELPGRSLRAAWTMPENGPASPVIVEATKGINVRPGNLTIDGAIRGAIDSTWHYIRYATGREELFAWRTDSTESVNLAGRPELHDAISRLRAFVSSTLDSVARQ